jgi:DNA-binding response OmpR family regulator
LTVFSNGLVPSLASLAPEIRDIDERLCAAAGSPRQLLNLGDRLFQGCAREADDNHLFIQPHQLDHVLAGSAIRPPPVAAAASVVVVPPLRICADGRIWRGDELIERSEKMPKLQRRLLEYLYEHCGQLCENQKIIDHVWAEELPSGEDGLRKLVKRVSEFIEPDPKAPVYIKNLRGFYRLDNAS